MKCEWIFYLPVNKETGDIDIQYMDVALHYPEDEQYLSEPYYALGDDWEWKPVDVTFKQYVETKREGDDEH